MGSDAAQVLAAYDFTVELIRVLREARFVATEIKHKPDTLDEAARVVDGIDLAPPQWWPHTRAHVWRNELEIAARSTEHVHLFARMLVASAFSISTSRVRDVVTAQRRRAR